MWLEPLIIILLIFIIYQNSYCLFFNLIILINIIKILQYYCQIIVIKLLAFNK